MKVNFLGQLKVIFLSPLYTLDLSHFTRGKVWWDKKITVLGIKRLGFLFTTNQLCFLSGPQLPYFKRAYELIKCKDLEEFSFKFFICNGI